MPSELHNDLIYRALIWLSNNSTGRMRCCAEVPLDEGYVADGAAIMNPKMSFDKELFGEYCSTMRKIEDWPEVDDFSFVIESKVSKSDFRNTFILNNHTGSRLTPRANFHFLVVAKKVLSTHLSDDVGAECVPNFWGILEQAGTGVRLVRKPTFCPQTINHLHEFAYRILRFTKHGKFSDWDIRQGHFFGRELNQLTTEP